VLAPSGIIVVVQKYRLTETLYNERGVIGGSFGYPFSFSVIAHPASQGSRQAGRKTLASVTMPRIGLHEAWHAPRRSARSYSVARKESFTKGTKAEGPSVV
jgi:hypothetical protein